MKTLFGDDMFSGVMYVTNQSDPHANYFLWYWLFNHTQQTGMYRRVHYPSGWDWLWLTLLAFFVVALISAAVTETRYE